MKKTIKDIIKAQGTIINYKDSDVKYLEIANFIDAEFTYGIIEDGWLVKKKNNQYLVDNEEENYIIFFNLLELPNDKILDNINVNIESLLNSNLSIFDFFPIVEITKTAISMESSYWAILCLDLLLKSKLYSLELLNYLFDKKDDKWLPQPLKHKILKYISRTRDQEWNKSKLHND